MDPVIYKYHQPFTLESGISLPKLKIAYHYYGEYTPGKKVAWVCHALTANSDVADWWKGLVGRMPSSIPTITLLFVQISLGHVMGQLVHPPCWINFQ